MCNCTGECSQECPKYKLIHTTPIQGEPGIGIQNIEVNEFYELIVTFDDNTIINLGTLPEGPQGPQGLQGDVGPQGPAEYEYYIETSIEHNEILNMGTNPIILLPSLDGVDTYYEFKIILEYRNVSNFYLLGNSDRYCIWGDGEIYKDFHGGTLGANNKILFVSSYSTSIELSNGEVPETGIYFTTYNQNNPTGGPGSILAKIWYNIRTMS
jgi:hypothetical protein